MPIPEFNRKVQGCNSLRVRHSLSVEQLRDALLSRMALVGRSFVTLHLRRGEVKAECDTRLETVVRYVNCSKTGGLPLVVFTDERDTVYLHALLVELSVVLAGAPVYHGDALLEPQIARYQDNFLMYTVAGAVQHQATGWLVRRHKPLDGWCNHCDDAFANRRRQNTFDGLVASIRGP